MKIVYVSNAGHAQSYAELLGEKLKIEAVPFTQIKKVKKTEEIIFISWVFANSIVKFKTINNRYNVIAVVAVGMNSEDSDNNDLLIDINDITIPFFYARGGIDYSKLKGIKKKLLQMVEKNIVKQNKKEDQERIKIFQKQGNFVSLKNLENVINYIEHMDKED